MISASTVMRKSEDAQADYEMRRSARHEPKHTALPWRTRSSMVDGRLTFIESDLVERIACCKTEEDAALIVRAVNAHDDLMKIAGMLARFDEKEGLSPGALGTLKDWAVAAIAKAGA